MFRRYFTSAFLVGLLTLFASTRKPATPTDRSAVSGIGQESQNRRLEQKNKKPSDESQAFGSSKTVYQRDDVCTLALDSMWDKLQDADIKPLPQNGAAAGPSTRTIEAMIALVPDPIHTHLALAFDRSVDTIQQALQDAPAADKPDGWVYTSQWLPWDPTPYQAAEDPIDRTNVRTFDHGSECAPGLLIFHNFQASAHSEPSRFLVVLLVGESPTGGINERQFGYALQVWHTIEGGATASGPEEPVLRVLGPSFSTSLFSLDRLLHENSCSTGEKPNCIQTAKVVSGSVSADPTTIGQEFPDLKSAHFLSLTESAASRRRMVLDYFRTSENITGDQVALLSEDQTPFGNFSGYSAADSQATDPGLKSPLIFHFPREISQLRNAYEQNSILNAPSSNQSQTAPNQTLKLSLEDRHEQEDDVPSFSSQQDSISQESILSSITRTMASHDIRVVVISATDVLDEMFVARFLSRDLPNARIVLTDADQILLRRAEAGDFRGMMTATTYPLIQDDTGWNAQFLPGQPDNRLPDRIFPSTEMVGIYNATRVLEPYATLTDDQAEAKCKGRPDCNVRWLSGYENPFSGGDRPPLWLSAIGRSGFWPVALLDNHSTTPAVPQRSGDSASSNKTQNQIPPDMFPSVSEQRLAAACILLLFVLFGITFCAFSTPVLRWPEYSFVYLKPDPATPATEKTGTDRERRAWIVLSIILSYSWITRLLILDLPWNEFVWNPINWILVATEAILFAFAVWLIRTALSKASRPFWAGLLVLLTVVAQIAMHWILLPTDFARQLFYLYRSEHLLSGVSPGMPFICLFAAFICLVSRHIQALLVFSPDWRPRVPCFDPTAKTTALGTVNSEPIQHIFRACCSSWRFLHDQIRGKKEKLHFLSKLFYCTCLVLAIAIASLARSGFQTLERPAYSRSLTALSLLIALFLLYEIVWVVVIWDRLRHGLLIPLERSRLRVCFSRVAGFSWRRLWLSLDLSLISRYKPLSRAHESVDHLRRTSGCPPDVMIEAHQVCGAFQNVHDAMKEETTDPSTLFESFKKYQTSLRDCANTVIESILLQPSHNSGPLVTRCDATAEVVAAELDQEAASDPVEASAEEFVGLIYIHAIQHVLIDIRSHVLAFVCGYLFLILALNIYPVDPHHNVILLLSGLFIVFVGVVLLVFTQMHRDSILSRTTNTEIGKLGLDFYEKLVPVIGVPLIGLLASLFPEISSFLFSWLQPSLQAIK